MGVSDRKSGSSLVHGDAAEIEDGKAGDELVRFFLALPPDARADYARLADLDRRFGEDVGAEERARASQDAGER